MTSIGSRIDQLLDEPRLRDLVAYYFDPNQGFAGRLFDEVGDNPPDEFTTGDLLAVTLLDVALGPRAVRALLQPTTTEWSEKLHAITTERSLLEATDHDLTGAGVLWTALDDLPGVGATKAGKLLARKRPRLIPIYDDVVERFLQPTAKAFWSGLREALSDSDRRRRVDELDPDPDRGSPNTVRLLDVALWMRCSRSRNATRARVEVGLPAARLEPR